MAQDQADVSGSMPAPLESYVVYQPPAWGQALRNKDARRSYASILAFLEHCASVTQPPDHATLTIHERSESSPSAYEHESYVGAASDAFGPGDRQAAAPMSPDTGHVYYKHAWRLPFDRIDELIDLVASGPAPVPKTVPPISVFVAWSFQLRDPRSGDRFPTVVPDSRLELFLANAPTASFDLNFPFERPDREFLRFLFELRPYLPFRLAKSRFRQLAPAVGGGPFTRRKIATSVFQGL
jgi:hypothetical protein